MVGESPWKGLKRVARGQSEASAPGMDSKEVPSPGRGGSESACAAAAAPPGLGNVFCCLPGVAASLCPRATCWRPSGASMKRAAGDCPEQYGGLATQAVPSRRAGEGHHDAAL